MALQWNTVSLPALPKGKDPAAVLLSKDYSQFVYSEVFWSLWNNHRLSIRARLWPAGKYPEVTFSITNTNPNKAQDDYPFAAKLREEDLLQFDAVLEQLKSKMATVKKQLFDRYTRVESAQFKAAWAAKSPLTIAKAPINKTTVTKTKSAAQAAPVKAKRVKEQDTLAIVPEEDEDLFEEGPEDAQDDEDNMAFL